MNYDNYEVIDSESTAIDSARSFFANVYKYMFVALAVSGVTAYLGAASGWYLKVAFNLDGGLSAMGYVLMFAPVAVVLFLQFRINKISMGSAIFIYLLYSVLIGLSLSFIFYIYNLGSIGLTFLVTAGTFGAMALIGYTTKADLSKMGSLLWMVFIGMFIASIANLIIGSDTLSWIVSFLGLFVFTGLTAWEMQRLKVIALSPVAGEERKKHELIGGLTLYILFINLFLTILRFIGDR
ncbi:MAG: Bax inhibitor-1/YccA family protein [Crocinitomicaceae bacterium]